MERFYKNLSDILSSGDAVADTYFRLPLEVRRKVDTHASHIITVDQLKRQMDTSLADFEQNSLSWSRRAKADASASAFVFLKYEDKL